ncbi:6585_t:CDS:1 [Dentiscutata heterogama]|uniref:6585_t:CDS:1 n=1 Tax=Dentiscutata heterogama TaxID=1316150 RepID=A0ACA9KR39_9GLOM|nr:6585_t:CDS:1 [Dentiscutata heterogama]
MKPKKFDYTSSVPMSQMSNTSSSSLLSYFNAYNHDQIDSSSPSHFNIYEQDIISDFLLPCFNTYELALPYFSYEHNIENILSFYPNTYKYYDNINTSSLPYPGPYRYNSAMSTYINFQALVMH